MSRDILETQRNERKREGGESVYLPWWVILAGLVTSALVAYLLLERTQAGDSPWVLFPLTAALAPVILLGVAVAAIALSVLLSMLLEDRNEAPPGPPEEHPARTEHTGAEATTEGTDLETTLEPTLPATTVSPTASPTASPSATPTASPSASPTASPSP